MPGPAKKTTAKAKDTVRVEPASAAQPRVHPGPTTPSKKEVDVALEQSAQFLEEQSQDVQSHPGPTTPSNAEVDAALEQSAQHLEQQSEPPGDVHPNPTTPSKAEVESAVEQAKSNLEAQGNLVRTDTSAAPSGRDLAKDAAPVSAGGTVERTLGSPPVSGARDKTQDASPTFSAPLPDRPRE
jgi:hypothetical protein